MSAADLAIVAALIFGWGTVSARLERFDVTAPIIFVLAGLLLTHGPLAVLGVAPSKELIKELAEFTLALVLFSDASRVGLHELRVDAGLYVRLLGVALPLTIGLGTLLALWLAGGSIWLALLVGAALAPTDAALGAGMMVNPAVPASPDGAGRGRAGRRTARLGDGRPGGLVRSRGLASVVFALLALEELGSPTADRAVAVITITVLLSVVAHGATAEPLAARYAKLLAHGVDEGSGTLTPDMPDRRLIRGAHSLKGDPPGHHTPGRNSKACLAVAFTLQG